jgi:hypothetical protein
MKTLDTLPLMKRVLFLRKVPLFAELTPSDLSSVAKAAEENLYPGGELIAAQGNRVAKCMSWCRERSRFA